MLVVWPLTFGERLNRWEIEPNLIASRRILQNVRPLLVSPIRGNLLKKIVDSRGRRESLWDSARSFFDN